MRYTSRHIKYCGRTHRKLIDSGSSFGNDKSLAAQFGAWLHAPLSWALLGLLCGRVNVTRLPLPAINNKINLRSSAAVSAKLETSPMRTAHEMRPARGVLKAFLIRSFQYLPRAQVNAPRFVIETTLHEPRITRRVS